MPTLPEIRIPMPEEENKTLYGYITNSGEPPKFDDIRNSNLSPEEKVRQAQYRTQAYQDDLDRQLHKDYARMGVGTALSAASFHPFFNIPYVGTGIGGAMYDLGQGIVEGDTAGDLAKRAGRGFVIGETIGAIPYAGKALGKTKAGQAVINSAPVQAVGNVLNKAGEKFANSKLYDTLMTDVRAFNPNKQTAYHGSPYDFNKFSNEAIGTGEGAQAHGYGHYAALDKDTAEAYAKNLSEGNKVIEYNGKIYKSNAEFKPNEYNYKMLSDVKTDGLEAAKNFYKDQEQWAREKLAKSNDKKWWEDTVKAAEGTNRLLDTVNPNLISDIRPDTGQLYKLSVPKDDVMLREGASFAEQPELVQKGLTNIKNNYIKSKGYNSIDEINAELDKLSNQYENIVKNESPYDFYAGTEKAKVQGEISKLENLRRLEETPDIYDYLVNHQNLEPQEVSDLLSKQGIKGISYNGGIDGEARVIFNPDDIVIGRKYYNQPNLYEQLTGKQNTGALVDALFNR